jgi:hypothetical protein
MFPILKIKIMKQFQIKNYRFLIAFGGTKNLESSLHFGLQFFINIPEENRTFISLKLGVLYLLDLTIMITKL